MHEHDGLWWPRYCEYPWCIFNSYLSLEVSMQTPEESVTSNMNVLCMWCSIYELLLDYRPISGIRSTAIRSNKVSKRQGPIWIKTIRSYDRNLTHEGRPPDPIPNRPSVPHPSKMNKPAFPARQPTQTRGKLILLCACLSIKCAAGQGKLSKRL